MTTVEVGRETGSVARYGLPAPMLRGAGLSDADLVAAAIANESWAWAALVERYSRLVASTTWSYQMRPDDAAEIQQVVWLRLLENIHRIRDTDRLAGWIRAVARNECRRTSHKNRREVLGIDEGSFQRKSDDIVESRLLAQERQAAVRGALARLPDKARTLLESQLAAPELTYAELAAMFDMPRGSVGPTRQRCLGKLRSTPEIVRLTCLGPDETARFQEPGARASA